MTSIKKTIVIGSDKVGLPLKRNVLRVLANMGIPARDVGTYTTDEPWHYPDYAAKVADVVSQGVFDQGVLVCGTGIGTSIVANRFPGVRAVVCTNVAMAVAARKRLDSNVLVLSSEYTHDLEVVEIVRTFFETGFDGDNNARRIKMIDDDLRLHVALGHLGQVAPHNIRHENVNEPFFMRAVKGFEKIMSSYRAHERRDNSVARQVEACPTTFTINGKEFKGIMVNMSERGGDIQISRIGEQPKLIQGDMVEMEIKTPYGKSECCGTVRWFDWESGHFGVSFMNFPHDRKDPICLQVDAMM